MRSVAAGAAVGIVVLFLLVAWTFLVFLQFDLSHHTVPWTTAYKPANFDWDGERPLKVVFMSWGSRGDHQPNVALGLELARRGHEVTVMGMKRYQPLIERHAPAIRYQEIVDSNLWNMAEAFRTSNGADFIPITTDYIVKSSREMIPQYCSSERSRCNIWIAQRNVGTATSDRGPSRAKATHLLDS